MTAYHILWEIDVEADSPRAAAEKALEIQRRQGSSAVVFDVYPQDRGGVIRVDLDKPDDGLDEAAEGFECSACGRPEHECSADPCAAVLADREA